MPNPEVDDKVAFKSKILGPSAPRGAPAASRYDPFGTLSLITGFVSSLRVRRAEPIFALLRKEL
ncbi:hypothetical protein D3C79_287190 [compost metagenome]